MIVDPEKAPLWKILPHTYAQKCSRGEWIPYPHLKIISQEIAYAIMGGNGRLIINLPPRHGKSELISNWTPTWFLDLFPKKRIILASYSGDFATKWGRKVKWNTTTNSLINVTLRQDSKAASRFETLEGGGMITAGMDGQLTGEGGDLIIIDDPVKNWKDAMSEVKRESSINAYKSAIRTRLEPGGTIILLMTRWTEGDLAGYLIDNNGKEDDSGNVDDWKLINFPAIAEANDPMGREIGEALCPERYTVRDFEAIKKEVGPRIWPALYQGQPTTEDGEMWKRSYWKRYHPHELPEKLDEIIQSWDMTFKEAGTSYVVGQVWGRKGSQKYLIDEVRDQWGFDDSVKEMLKLTAKYPKAFRKLVENKANGPAIENHLKKKVSGIKLVNPDGGKILRASVCEPTIAAGDVHIPYGSMGDEFINEAASFPKGKNDDRVDTASQAISFLEKKINSSIYKLIQR